WMARRYETPFLQVVYNNRGWKAPKFSALAIHPDGYASRAANIDVSFDPPPDYAAIAVAAGRALRRHPAPCPRGGAAHRRGPARRPRRAALRRPRRLAAAAVRLSSGAALGYSLRQNHLAETNGGNLRPAHHRTGSEREEGPC